MKALSEPARTATIYEVARHAGVSIATVSRVLRGTTRVSEGTRERVLAAVEDLRFTPSRPARSLAEGQHAANGIVFPDLSGPYFAEVVLAYEEVAADLGRSVLILSTHGRQAAREMAARPRRPRGRPRRPRPDRRRRRPRRTSSARACRWSSWPASPIAGADSVNTENLASARALTAHLVEDHGYRSFAFLGDAADLPGHPGALAGLPRGTARRRGGSPPVAGRLPVRRGRRACCRRHACCAAGRRGSWCAPTTRSPSAPSTAAEALGLRVPDDVAVTGWDDVMAARHSRPGLTTVRQPMRELGAWAARRLHERLAGDTSAPRHEVLPTQLVRRASCGHHTEEDR